MRFVLRSLIVGCFAILGASCSSDTRSAALVSPSLSGETMPERAAAFHEIARSIPFEISTFDGGVIDDYEPDAYSTQAFALYPATDSDKDYEGWLAEVWEIHRVLEQAGFEGVHFNCSNNFVAANQFRAFYEDADGALITLDWPSQRADQGSLVAGFTDGRPDRLEDIKFEPGPNPEMCLPAAS